MKKWKKDRDESYKEKDKKNPEIWLKTVKMYKIKKIMFFLICTECTNLG